MSIWKKSLVACSFIMLAACGNQVADESTVESVTVTDGTGQLSVPYQPEKVVVFDNGTLDTMRALDLGDNIVGAVTSNAPSYLADFSEQFEDAGTLKEPNMETVASMQPDLIIISNRMADFTEQLEEIAPVLLLSTDSENYWPSVRTNIETIGSVFGVEQEAGELVAETEEVIEATKEKTDSIDGKAMVLMLNDGAISAFSSGSRFGYIFDEFGFHPVDAEIERSTHGQSIGYEGILEINPDIIFVVDRSKAVQGAETNQAALLDNDFIRQTNAHQNDRIIQLSPDLWYLSGSGVESFRLMMEEVTKPFE